MLDCDRVEASYAASDANARASVRSPSGRTHAATVTSLLGTPGFEPPGLMEMRMRHAAAFAGEPARLFDIHPSDSAVSARAGRLHPRARVRPADGGLRPRDAARQVPRARGRPRRRHDPLRGQGQPGARDRGGGGGARRALRLRLARRDRPLPRRSACRPTASPSATPSSAPPTSPTPTRMGVEQFAADAEEEMLQDRRARPGRAGDHAHAGRGQPRPTGRSAASSAARGARRCG